ncbi:MAG: UvrD-helicase domain-containing protein [Candidatus Gracilibacteria bacterium]|nr:UvrD-helicase domain-containing protein [Candidatus Gracilibacteria bacterium]
MNTENTNVIVDKSIKIDIQNQIIDLIAKYNFKEADGIFKKYGAIFDFDINKYEKYKAIYIGKYFYDNYNLKFGYDIEQLEAIASIHKNTLITARAGSGKTQVIAGKTAYLLDSEKLYTSDILLLSFNKKAAKEINERIVKFGDILKNKNEKLKTFENAMTFHSLAYKILGTNLKNHDIIMDTIKITDPKTGLEKEFITNKQLKFIQNCFYSIYEGKIKQLMQEYLINETIYFKHSGYLDDDEKYYNYRKNKEFQALSGDYVRSKGEKYLIDILIEHGFEVIYEPYIKIDGDYLSKPDIMCNISKNGKKLLSRDIIIEHWGFDEDDCFKKLPIGKAISGSKYAKIRKQKVLFWENEEKKGNYYFVQTTANELYNNKNLFIKNFQEKIENILNKEGIYLELIDKNILIVQLRKNEKKIFPFTNKLEHFINKAQQKNLDYKQIEKEILNTQDEQERAFLIVANEVYKKYEEEKIKNKMLDFNQILKLAGKKLADNYCDLDIKIGNNTINLSKIKYLIIDEYQDFSTLFYNLLESILEYNKLCNIFVVGDSWQSINAFAGSELGYFFDFRKLFHKESTSIKNITTNYRSRQTIVEMGNNLMKYEGSGDAKWLLKINDGGETYTYIDVKNYPLCTDSRINEIFYKKDDLKVQEQEKYIFKNIVNIINHNKGKTFMIISRNNRVFGNELVDWRMKLYFYYFKLLIKNSDIDIQKSHSNIENKIHKSDTDSFNNLNELFNNRIEFITAHKSKGKEADIVIMLDISEKKYPSNVTSLKDDVKYDRIFGITSDSLLKDERRLFYVALTRAKEKIYMISENGKDSGLLKELIV